MNNSFDAYIRREIFATISNEAILQYFQKMQTHQMQLPPFNRVHHMSGTRIGGNSNSCMHR